MSFIQYRSNAAAFDKPIEVLLTMFYSVKELWEPVRNLLYPALRTPVPPKKPKKSTLVKDLCDAFSNKSKMEAFLAAASPETRAAWNMLVWAGDQPLAELEEALGFEIAEKNPGKRNFRDPPLIPHSDFPFVVLDDPSYLYRYYRDENLREGVVAKLPPALRMAFRKHMPKPDGYYIEPVSEAPKAATSFRCDSTALENLRFLAQYIEMGNLKLTKARKIRKACLREIAATMGGGEFFGDDPPFETLHLLRTSLVASFMGDPGKKAVKHILSTSPDGRKKAFRLLAIAMFTNPDWIRQHLLEHLKGTAYTNPDGLNPLFDLFADIGTEGWVKAENLDDFARYREIRFDILHHDDLWTEVDHRIPGQDFHASRRLELRHNNTELLTGPLIRGTAFLLASMGFAEILYDPPQSAARLKRAGAEFLTPFDGLVALRLTPLGAFALGKTEELNLDASPDNKVRIVLNEHRLTLTCRNPDRMTILLLEDYMEKISEGCYRMTRQSLLRGCKNAANVSTRIEQFKKRIATGLPPLWKEFFAEVTESCVALKKKPGYVVYTLSDTPELGRLFLSDPVLKAKTIKTAGPGVAIDKNDIPAVSRRLAALGYLMQ